jgi:hypothetical protein
VRHACAALLAGAAVAAAAAPAAAQCPGATSVADVCPLDPQRWVGEFTALGANALLGGVTAGVTRALGGGAFRDGFMRGLVGGTAVYAGKRVATERFAGAGLLGRQVAAAGVGLVRAAGSGEPALARVPVPIGPLWLDVRPAERRLTARLDVAALGWIVYGVLEPELHFAAGRSVSSGAAVFRTRDRVLLYGDSAHAAGVTNAGVVFVADVPAYGDAFLERALAHERVHVIQQDFLSLLWTDPLARRVVRDVCPASRVLRSIDVNLSTELMRGVGRFFKRHEDRPWELEAIFLAR